MTRKHIVIISFASLALLLCTITLILFARGDKWKAYAINRMNEQLTTEFTVEEVKLSIWSEFPKISVDLEDIALMGSTNHAGATPDTLLSASRLGVAFSLWDVVFNEPIIQELILEGASVRLVQTPTGNWNTDVFEENSMGGNTPNITILDSKVDVEQHNGPRFSGFISHASIEGNDINVSFSDLIGIGKDIPKELLPLTGYVSAMIKSENENGWGFYIVASEINGIALSGSIDLEEELRFQAKFPGLNLSNLDEIWNSDELFEGWDYGGYADISISGTRSEITIEWVLPEDDFSISSHLTGLALDAKGTGNAEGSVVWTAKNTGIAIDISKIKAVLNGVVIDSKIRCDNVKSSPWNIDGVLKLDVSYPFTSWIPAIQGSSWKSLPSKGELVISGGLNVNHNGAISNINCTIESSRLEGLLDASPYSLTNVASTYRGGDLNIESLTYFWGGNNGEFNGELKSINRSIEGGKIIGNLNLRAENMSINPILNCWNNYTINDSPPEQAKLLPPGSRIEIRCGSSNLIWDELECADLIAKVIVKESRLTILNASTMGLEGKARIEGSLKPGGPGWILSLAGTADDISLPELFRTYNNFDQTALRNEHLGGAVSVAGNIRLGWALDGGWSSEALSSNLDVIIEHGRLRNVEVFDDVADYLNDHRIIAPFVDPEDLRSRLSDIEFDRLETTINIAHSSTIIEYTNIQSSAMDISIEGIHSFDGKINYTMGFALRDLKHSRKVEFGQIQDDGLGNKFFLGMNGTLENPEYFYDRESHRKHRKKALEEETDRIKDAIKEFRKKPDPSPTPANPKSTKGKEKKKKDLNDIEDEDF